MYTDTHHINFDGKNCQLQIIQEGIDTWFLLKHEGKMLAKIYLDKNQEWASFPKLSQEQMDEIMQEVKRMYE